MDKWERCWRVVIRVPVNFCFGYPEGAQGWNKDLGTSKSGEPRVVLKITCIYRGLRQLPRFRIPTLWSLPDSMHPESRDHLCFFYTSIVPLADHNIWQVVGAQKYLLNDYLCRWINC